MANVAHPILGALPVFDKGRHEHEGRWLADHGKDKRVVFRIASDRAKIASVGRGEIPHRRPSPKHQTVDPARSHFLARHGPTPVAFGLRQSGQFKPIAHWQLRISRYWYLERDLSPV